MRYWLVVMAGLCLAQPALAASAPPTTVMLGTSAIASGSGVDKHHCGTNPGPAGFQRGAASAGTPNPPAILNLPAVFASGPALSMDFSFTGVVLLHFTTATGGVASFDFDQGTVNSKLPSGKSVPFGGYSQVWTASAGTLRVSFNILFSDCTLPVAALFRTIP